MLRLFRINDPFRVLIALFLLILMRLPFLLSQKWILSSEIEWLVIGESLGGGSVLYKDIWSTLPPLSAGVYWLVNLIFDKSYLTLRVLSIVVVTLQAFVLNRTLIRYDIYNEKTYLPAFLYMLFMNSSTDFMTLSPELLSLTFLVFALNYILKPEKKGRNEEFLLLGINLGLAFFFSYLSVVFLLFSLLVIPIFRSSSWQSVFAILFGVFIIFAIISTYFFINEGVRDFSYQYLASYFIYDRILSFSVFDFFLQLGLPIVFLIFALQRVLRESAFVNYQVSCQQIMFFWGVLCLVIPFGAERFLPSQIIFLVPVLGFFVAHHVLLFRKKRLAELYINVVFIVAVLLGVSGIYFQKSQLWPISYDKLWANPTILEAYRNKKVVVLGGQTEYYLKNQLVTPYFNWEIANALHFSRMNNYNIIQEVSESFIVSPPEIIIDQQTVMEDVFYHIPSLKHQYEKVPKSTREKTIYVRKEQ